MTPDIKLTGDSTIEFHGEIRVTDTSENVVFQSIPAPSARLTINQPPVVDAELTVGDVKIALPGSDLRIDRASYFGVSDDSEDLFTVEVSTDNARAEEIAPDYYEEARARNTGSDPDKVFVSDLAVNDRPTYGPSESYPIFRIAQIEDAEDPDDGVTFSRTGLRMWKYAEHSPPIVDLRSEDHSLRLGHEHYEWGGYDATLTQHGRVELRNDDAEDTVIVDGKGEPTLRLGNDTAGSPAGQLELLAGTEREVVFDSLDGITIGAKARGQATSSKQQWPGVGLFTDGTISAIYETDTVSLDVAELPAGNGLRYSPRGLGLVTKSDDAPDPLLDWNVEFLDGNHPSVDGFRGGAMVLRGQHGNERARMDASRDVAFNVVLSDDAGNRAIGVSQSGELVIGSSDLAGGLVVETSDDELIFAVDPNGTVTVGEDVTVDVTGDIN